jgi:hypothetical protein
MGIAAYEISGHGKEWHIHHDGESVNVYETKESVKKPASIPRLALHRRLKTSSSGAVCFLLITPPCLIAFLILRRRLPLRRLPSDCRSAADGDVSNKRR